MTNSTENETVVTEYLLAVRGVWGRKRKSDFTTARLADVDPASPLSEEAVQKLVAEKVAEMGVKPGARLNVTATEVTVKKCGEFTSRSFMMFSGKTVFQAVL